jgi:hypothetical protein
MHLPIPSQKVAYRKLSSPNFNGLRELAFRDQITGILESSTTRLIRHFGNKSHIIIYCDVQAWDSSLSLGVTNWDRFGSKGIQKSRPLNQIGFIPITHVS